MKKFYFFAFLFVAFFTTKAQYTLTTSMYPVIGDIERTWAADTTGVFPGTAGTNQIWNHTMINIPSTVTAQSKTYTAVSAAPNATAFPSANLAETSDGLTYNMWNYGPSNATIYGYTNSTITVVFGNPEMVFIVPFTYGTISSDTYSTSYVYMSNPVTILGTLTTTGDAWGTLNMPGGKSYPNTLRVKLQSTQTLTFGVVATQTTQTTSYAYVSAASKFAILSIDNSTTTTTSGTTTTVQKNKTVTVGDMIFTGVNNGGEFVKESNMNVYPNPNSGKEFTLAFNLKNIETYDITVYNSLGQLVKTVDLGELQPGMYTRTVPLTELNSGVYFVKLKSSKNESVKKLIIE